MFELRPSKDIFKKSLVCCAATPFRKGRIIGGASSDSPPALAGTPRIIIIKEGNILPKNMIDYEPFGSPINLWKNDIARIPNERIAYIGREKDVESRLGDHGVRKLDYFTGSFTTPDAMWEKYIGWSPYHYSMNDPVNLKEINITLDYSTFESALDFRQTFYEEISSKNNHSNIAKKLIGTSPLGVPADAVGLSACNLWVIQSASEESSKQKRKRSFHQWIKSKILFF